MPENEKFFNPQRAEEIQGIFCGRNGPAPVLIKGTTHGTPGTEKSFAHTAGKIPTGFLVVSQDKAASVYNGATASTDALIYLKSDVATVAITAILTFI